MHPENELDIALDVVLAFRERRWGLLFFGLFLWVIIAVFTLVITPFALIGAIWIGFKNFSLKSRRYLADKLRPKDVVRARNPEPQSDLVASFVEYELSLVSGKETALARSAIISELAHVEQELEEHRLLCAEIRKLRVEDERPRRRDAILSTKLRAERRRQREREEGTEK